MITLYTLPNCKHCEYIKARLKEEHIQFNLINLAEPNNIKIKKHMKVEEIKTVPILKIGKELMVIGRKKEAD